MSISPRINSPIQNSTVLFSNPLKMAYNTYMLLIWCLHLLFRQEWEHCDNQAKQLKRLFIAIQSILHTLPLIISKATSDLDNFHQGAMLILFSLKPFLFLFYYFFFSDPPLFAAMSLHCIWNAWLSNECYVIILEDQYINAWVF